MDSYTDEYGSKPPPPPSYDNMEEISLYEDILPPPPPPIKTPATPPPAYQDTNNPQVYPQNSYTGGMNAYPILNQPNQIQMVREQVLLQQSLSPVAPQVIVVQPQRAAVLDDTPTPTTCKYCLKSITTHVDYKPGFIAWAMCVLICLLGGFCGFCLIPFFVSGFQDAYHSCPSCKRHLGLYTRK